MHIAPDVPWPQDAVDASLLALLAITLPPLFILLVEKLYRRVKDHPGVEGFVRGLSLAVVGIFAVVLADLMRNVGLDVRSLLIAVAAFALGMLRRLPVAVILGLAALAGILLR